MDVKYESSYNKTILMNPIEKMEKTEKNDLDLCFYTYQGKLTSIVDVFNHQDIKTSVKLVASKVTEKNRTPLHIAAFLNFPNIFLYLLTFEADSGKVDDNLQSTWHILAYRGHTRIMGLLLNHIRYTLKQKSLIEIDKIKKEYGFSNLDIVKGKLSKAVYLTEVNIHKFEQLQKKVTKEAENLIDTFIDLLTKYLSAQDKNGQTPLHLAAMSKFSLSHEIINQILEFDFFKLDESWDDYLALFAEISSLEIKKERMNQDPRRCQRIERELITLLGEHRIKVDLANHYKRRKKEILKEIINIPDKNGDNLLHICSFHGNYKIINRLLYYGGKKRNHNKKNKIPVDVAKDNKVRNVLTNLNEAAKLSNEKDIQELVTFGKDINEKLSIFSFAPIHKIIDSKKDKKKKHEVLTNMLLLGSDPNIKDSNGWTALHYACQSGDIESVKILVDKKADIIAFSNNKRTPLHLASKMNFPHIVDYLIDKIISKNRAENKKYLNAQDENGCTPSHLAAKEGNTKCLETLLTKGADLYAVDSCGWNILHYASFHAHKDTIRFICKYDADYDKLLNTRNTQNKLPIEILSNYNLKPFFTTLWHAAKEGDLDMTKRLITNQNQNPNEQTYFEQNTPLHLAVLNNHFLEVNLLLKNGAKASIVNKHGILPSKIAAMMAEPIKARYKECKDIDREVFDLRDVITELMKAEKKEKRLPHINVDSTICEKNRHLRVWTANDFSEKINNEFQKINV